MLSLQVLFSSFWELWADQLININEVALKGNPKNEPKTKRWPWDNIRIWSRTLQRFLALNVVVYTVVTTLYW